MCLKWVVKLVNHNGCGKIPAVAKNGPVAQLGERYNGIVEVKGSSPFRSIVIHHQTEWYRGTLPSLSEMEGFFVFSWYIGVLVY
jgi:hypothetical protein